MSEELPKKRVYPRLGLEQEDAERATARDKLLWGTSTARLQRRLAEREVVGDDPHDDRNVLVRVPGRPDLFVSVPANQMAPQTLKLLSAKSDGYPGGKENSKSRIFCDVLVPEVAKECGQAESLVHRVLLGFGRIAQDAILRGQPVGIPYVGFLQPIQIAPREIEMTDAELIKGLKKKYKYLQTASLPAMESLALSVRRKHRKGVKKVIFRTTAAMERLFDYNIGEGVKPSWDWAVELKGKLREIRMEKRLRFMKKKNKHREDTF